MRRGRLLILVVLVLLFVAAFLFVATRILLRPRAPTAETPEGGITITPLPTTPPTANILVAVQQLPRGFKIPPGAVDVREWPVPSIPTNAIIVPAGTDPQLIIQQEIIGKIARSDIAIEQPILTTLLVPDLDQIAEAGSDAAAVLPQGLVAISVPINRLSGVAYAIQDGDRVDVIVSFVVVDVDEEFQTILPNQVFPLFYGAAGEGLGRSTASVEIEEGPTLLGRIDTIPPGDLANVVPVEPQRPRLVSQRVIENAFVVHVGDFPLGGRFIAITNTPTPTPLPTLAPEQAEAGGEATPVPTPIPTATPAVPDVVTLGVTPQDAVVLTWAINSDVNLNLTLRSARDVPQVPTTSVTLQYMVETYNITVPPKLPYSLEPAIRSVVQPTVTLAAPEVGGGE
jgi:Flp pilus assembly protein CpaB